MSQKKTYVGTSVQRVIADDKIPSGSQNGLMRALLQGSDLVESVEQELINSVGMRAERMFEYAKRSYTWGLPSGQFTTTTAAVPAVMAVLDAIEPAAVTLQYLHYGSPNNLHIGWMKLIASHGYNPDTNVLGALTATKGTTVWLDDMVVVVGSAIYDSADPNSLAQWGTAAKAGYTPERAYETPQTREAIQPSLVERVPGGTTEYLRVSYVWETHSGLDTFINRGEFTVPITGYNADANYFHAKYKAGAVTKYFMYEENAGTYPTLDAVYDKPPAANGQFFPFAYFRYDKHSEITDTSSAAYQTTKKLVKYLGMDYDTVATAIDENPDIDDVENAILMMAVPANTENALERRYLFEFFDALHMSNAAENRFSTPEYEVLKRMNLNTPQGSNPGIVIQDSRFKMALTNSGIYKRRVAGNIGPVGSYGSQRIKVSRDVWVDVPDNSPVLTRREYNKFCYRHQISTGIYEEIEVHDLNTVFWVYGRYTTIGNNADSILIVPLDHSITEKYSIPEREELYSRSMHYVFNARVVQKLEWYQTDLFQFVMIVVAIVIIIWTWDVPDALALIAAGEYAAAALLILEMVIEYVIFKMVFKAVVRWIGVEYAIYLAVIAAMLGYADYLMDGGILGAPWAQQLLQLASGLAQTITATLQDAMVDLGKEMQSFDEYKKEQLKLLESAQDLLESDFRLSPFVIFGEKPDDYYNRTVHSGNIGVIGFDAISNYVDTALTLPKLSDSLGGEGYAAAN